MRIPGTECDYQFGRHGAGSRAARGRLYSPRYPSTYPTNVRCNYHFHARLKTHRERRAGRNLLAVIRELVTLFGMKAVTAGGRAESAADERPAPADPFRLRV
ncbi:hypothetical protein EVAR_9660_1 [Eumeta japonica]|uniref:Uncharacterized protein n=1 Tax=Eumeta variegata TaxID=151549 RepID=A0A4C1TJN3_EUMVA|nr:hypothetical protein EVAR_9660_1 [Eumeta japonica]